MFNALDGKAAEDAGGVFNRYWEEALAAVERE